MRGLDRSLRGAGPAGGDSFEPAQDVVLGALVGAHEGDDLIEHLTHEDASDLIAFLAQGRDRFKQEGRQPVADYVDQLIAELTAADEREVAEITGFEQDLEAMSHGASEDAEVLGAQQVVQNQDRQGAGG